jgi:hypothetical protein
MEGDLFRAVGSRSSDLYCSFHLLLEQDGGGGVHAVIVGDRYPLGPLEGERASRGASSQLPRKAIPSWVGLELLAEWVDLRRQRIQAQAIRRIMRYPKKPSDFPTHGVLEYRGGLGMSRRCFFGDQFNWFTII